MWLRTLHPKLEVFSCVRIDDSAIFFSSMRSSQRRGRRGRPRTGKVRVQLKLSPETNEVIERRAAQSDITRSEYVERTILAAEKH
jgi:ERCC4-related helicase